MFVFEGSSWSFQGNRISCTFWLKASCSGPNRTTLGFPQYATQKATSVGASEKATSVEASAEPCCANTSILAKKSSVITTTTSRYFMVLLTSVSVFTELVFGLALPGARSVRAQTPRYTTGSLAYLCGLRCELGTIRLTS